MFLHGLTSKTASSPSRLTPCDSDWNAMQTRTVKRENPPNMKYGPELLRARKSGVENAITQLTIWSTVGLILMR
jgi:hypothetical protein